MPSRSPHDSTSPPLSRRDQKLRTRRALIDAALGLISTGRSFTNISLREVARAARIAPNAFYRHFDDMEALGLTIIDEGGVTLRRLLRRVREAGMPEGEVVRRSVETYVGYVREHRDHFAFVARERAGGSPAFREALRREIHHFAAEMADDLTSLGVYADLSRQARQLIAEIVVQMMLDSAIDIVDVPADRPELVDELVEQLHKRLILVFLGANAWRPGP